MANRYEFTQSVIYDYFDNKNILDDVNYENEDRDIEREYAAIQAAWSARWGLGNCDQNAYLSALELCKAFPKDGEIQVIQNPNHMYCAIKFNDGLELIIDPRYDDPVILSMHKIKEQEQKTLISFSNEEQKILLYVRYLEIEDFISKEHEFLKDDIPTYFDKSRKGLSEKQILAEMFDKKTIIDQEKIDTICEVKEKTKEKLKSALPLSEDFFKLKSKMVRQMRTKFLQLKMDEYIQKSKYNPKEYEYAQFKLPQELDPRTM